MANFPYKKTPNGDYFPIINFTLYFKNNITKTSALIDSGATISVFRSDVADQLNIQIEKGEMIYMHGVGGRIKGFIHRLKIEVAGKKFSFPIVFSHEYLVSLNLLGRDSFFDKFKITFEEKKKSVTLYS